MHVCTPRQLHRLTVCVAASFRFFTTGRKCDDASLLLLVSNASCLSAPLTRKQPSRLVSTRKERSTDTAGRVSPENESGDGWFYNLLSLLFSNILCASDVSGLSQY